MKITGETRHVYTQFLHNRIYAFQLKLSVFNEIKIHEREKNALSIKIAKNQITFV